MGVHGVRRQVVDQAGGGPRPGALDPPAVLGQQAPPRHPHQPAAQAGADPRGAAEPLGASDGQDAQAVRLEALRDVAADDGHAVAVGDQRRRLTQDPGVAGDR